MFLSTRMFVFRPWSWTGIPKEEVAGVLAVRVGEQGGGRNSGPPGEEDSRKRERGAAKEDVTAATEEEVRLLE